MKKIVCVYLYILWSVSLFADSASLNLDDLSKLIDTYYSQIEDMQYDFEVNMQSISDPSFRVKEKTSYSNVIEIGWEKETITTEITHGEEKKYVYTARSWNGEINKSYGASAFSLDELSTDSQRGAKKSSKKDVFSEGGILKMIGLRDEGSSIIRPYLYGDDIKIEGETEINGRKVIILSSNMIPTLPREKSLVYKYWLDLERGAIPVRLEYYEKNELRRIVKDIEIKEINPGMYFPISCKMENIVSSSKAHGVWSEGHISEYKVDIKTLKLNSGPKGEFFDLEFEHNTPVWDADVGIGYYQGVGLQEETMTDAGLLSDIAKASVEEIESKTVETKPKVNIEVHENKEDIPTISHNHFLSNNNQASKKKFAIILAISSGIVILGAVSFWINKKTKGSNRNDIK